MASSTSSVSSSLVHVPTFSVRDKQCKALLRLLNFNKSQEAKETWEEPWKILIYDAFCRDIISPLLRVGELRKQGVTLHLLLDADRQEVPDVPAVYFVLPTKSNVKRICEDCKNHLYDTYHLNFASSIPRPLMEELAASVVESDSVSQIAKVYDQYLNFVSLEDDMFSFNQKQSYIAFNDPTLSDTDAEANIESVVDGLFSVLVTLGVIPIIRCPKAGAAEAVARQLDAKLNDHLSNMGNLFSESTASFQRPVLILLDRNIDLTVALHHTWTYQALAHDLLGTNLNRIQIEVQDSEDSSKKEKKVYDLDSTDAFWSENRDTAFPNIAVAVDSYLKAYNNALDDFKRMSGGVDIENYDESQMLGRTKDLGSFVNTIPALREKKRIIDEHTNIATALLNEIKARELYTYFGLEEGLMTRSSVDKKELLALLSDPNRGTIDDKLRLFLIYFMSNENIPASDMEQFDAAITKVGGSLLPLKFLKKTKAFNESIRATLNPTNTGASPTTGIRGMLQKANVESFGLGGGLTKQLSTLFTTGVKALLPTTQELYVTRIVDAIMEMKNELGVENYCYFDPKVQKKMRQTAIPRKSTPFKEGLVFVVGGGNYVEYQNLQDYAKKHSKHIIYGSTAVTTASDFLQQFTELSKKL